MHYYIKRVSTTDTLTAPSNYLMKISTKYNKVIKLLLDHKIIDYQSFNTEDIDIFTSRRKKYYNTEKGKCIRYKFIIDTEIGYECDIKTDYTSLYDKEKWYMKTRYSLLHIGFGPEELKISRDNFSRRLHTNITGNIGDSGSYKDLLSGGEYWTIDAKTCHPRLLWILLKEVEQEDKNLSYIFDNNIDFYDYILEKAPSILRSHNEVVEVMKRNNEYQHTEEEIKDIERRIAKDAFMTWTNGKGYTDDDIKPIVGIFPIANNYIRGYKSTSYKEMCKKLQYTEAKIFIDDILNEIPLEFCLTVHDSIIVRKEDVESSLRWCQERHPELIFIPQEIKRR